MRPINLIPEDERGAGGGAVSIRGLRVWGIGGGLALAVIGIVMLVTTSNALSEREHEVERLEHEQTVAEARAAKLDPYTAFQQTAMARRETVATLAASRFDWERVMRELALIVPDDVTVLSLTATVSSETSVSGGASVELRGEVPGPALEISGCATGPQGEAQVAVAGFISALYDIDGVTRVGMTQSGVGADDDGTGGGTGGAAAGEVGCPPGGQVANFDMVAAFDSAPVPGEDVPVPPLPDPDGAPAAGEAETVPASRGGATGGSGSDGADDLDTVQADRSAQQSAADATRQANAATETFIPGG